MHGPQVFNHIPPLASLTADDQKEIPSSRPWRPKTPVLTGDTKAGKELKQAEARQRRAEGQLVKLQKEAETKEQTTAAEAAREVLELGQYYSSIKAQDAAAVFDELMMRPLLVFYKTWMGRCR